MTQRSLLGAEIVTSAERGVQFRVWAPAATRIAVVIEPDGREVVLERAADGYATGFVAGPLTARAIATGSRRASSSPIRRRASSRGAVRAVAGRRSRAVRLDDGAWRGMPSMRQVIYELHVGTFTPRGHVARPRERAAVSRATLGITTIELMPVDEFAGAHGWGYDGVNLFAPHHALRHARRSARASSIARTRSGSR